MTNDLISIVVPVYNAERYIKRCIDSIINQSYHNWELILVNDGSTDNSKKIIYRLVNKNDGNRIILKNLNNSGPSVARNEGIKLSNGKYITFIDSDDYISNDFLETLVKNIGDKKFIVSGYNKIIDKKILVIKPRRDNKWNPFRFCSTWGKLYERKFIVDNKIQFPAKYKIGEDLYFIMNILTLTNKYTSINYAGYNYWINTSSLTNSSKHASEMKSYIELLSDIIEMCSKSFYIKEKTLLYFICKTFLFYLFLINECSYKNLRNFYYQFSEKINKLQLINLFKLHWQPCERFSINLLYNSFCILRKIKCESTVLIAISIYNKIVNSK